MAMVKNAKRFTIKAIYASNNAFREAIAKVNAAKI